MNNRKNPWMRRWKGRLFESRVNLSRASRSEQARLGIGHMHHLYWVLILIDGRWARTIAPYTTNRTGDHSTCLPCLPLLPSLHNCMCPNSNCQRKSSRHFPRFLDSNLYTMNVEGYFGCFLFIYYIQRMMLWWACLLGLMEHCVAYS